MSLNLSISKLYFPGNQPIANSIQVNLFWRLYYPANGAFTQFGTNVPIDVNGNVLGSPPPSFSMDPSMEYVIRAVNSACGFIYEQVISVNPYCPIGYQLSGDGSYCYKTVTTSATPPSAPENSVAVNHLDYGIWASLIYDPGYNVNGTGTFTQIPFSNAFFLNGVGYPSGTGSDTIQGPLNRSGLWATSALSNQTIGFSLCINAPVTGTYYVGIGSDNFASIILDSTTIVNMDPTAMGAYLAANGYPGVGVESTFRFWHIYPVHIAAGMHILELIGNNVSSVASLGAEVYLNTPAQIIAASSYSGLDLIFSSKDYIGMPIELGSDNIGYQCPDGYALNLCGSPVVCVKTITTPIIF